MERRALVATVRVAADLDVMMLLISSRFPDSRLMIGQSKIYHAVAVVESGG